MSNSYRDKAISQAKADVEYWNELRKEHTHENRDHLGLR